MAILRNTGERNSKEAVKEFELVEPPLIQSSSPILKIGKSKRFGKNRKGLVQSIKKISWNSHVEEVQRSDSDIEVDAEEIGGSSDEDGDGDEEVVAVLKLGELGFDDDEGGAAEMGNASRSSDGVAAASSRGLPVLRPIFHASARGRWHAMIAYDACLRLCHSSWAMGRKEASVFLDKECKLLREAFRLHHVLLKPEVELLEIRSSMPSDIFSAPKMKKTVDRCKVQVRKLQMDLISPKGCIFSSFRPSKTYSCILRMSSNDDDIVHMQPGSSVKSLVFPESVGNVLILEVQDSKGKYYGRVVAQVDTFIEGGKSRWLPIYREPEHELVGRIKLFINCCASVDENGHLKCGLVSETVAYDFVLEVAMKAQDFKQRNLLLHGEWKWLLTEFASYYGVSNAYVRLRYVSYVMDVATPTADCLALVYDLLSPIKMKGSDRSTLSCLEKRILGEIEDQLERILSLAFENYKALDESSLSGIVDGFRSATGTPAPALAPALKLYNLLHDTKSPVAQLKLCRYFQVAAKKRSRRHLAEMDEFLASNGEGTFMNAVTLCSAYQKMVSLCSNIRNEIITDIKIHSQHLLPRCIDLPCISSSIYSTELCTRLRAFLVKCPPQSPSSPVAELVIATADLQKDLISWNFNHVKGGIDAKELFHPYIISWIQNKRLSLLDTCKIDRVKRSGVGTQQYMYDRRKETLSEYEFILCRWPEYTVVLENAIEHAEKALAEALNAHVLSPLLRKAWWKLWTSSFHKLLGEGPDLPRKP